MKNKLAITAFLFAATISSCKKDNNATTGECFPGTSTVRVITNARAVVQSSGSQFYIVEEGTIDTKLNPCNLAQEFRQNNLQVTISGEVKLTLHGGPEPCCTDDFVITKISK